MSLPELIWQQVGTTVDVHFGAEYRISKAVGVFLRETTWLTRNSIRIISTAGWASTYWPV